MWKIILEYWQVLITLHWRLLISFHWIIVRFMVHRYTPILIMCLMSNHRGARQCYNFLPRLLDIALHNFLRTEEGPVSSCLCRLRRLQWKINSWYLESRQRNYYTSTSWSYSQATGTIFKLGSKLNSNLAIYTVLHNPGTQGQQWKSERFADYFCSTVGEDVPDLQYEKYLTYNMRST